MTPEFDEEVVFEVGAGETRGGLGAHLSAPCRGVAGRPQVTAGRGALPGAAERSAAPGGPRAAAAAVVGPGVGRARSRSGGKGMEWRCADSAPFCEARWGRDKGSGTSLGRRTVCGKQPDSREKCVHAHPYPSAAPSF